MGTQYPSNTLFWIFFFKIPFLLLATDWKSKNSALLVLLSAWLENG